MKKHTRLKELEAYIRAHEAASLDELCDAFGVSKNTIRRDLGELKDRGLVSKIYGGVIANGTSANLLSPFEERSGRNTAAKDAIARAAASLIEEGDIVFLDSGTTAARLAACLPPLRSLTVVTHNLPAATLLASRSDAQLIVLGGLLERNTGSLLGKQAEDMLRHLNFTKCFLGAAGLSIERGVTNSSLDEFALKRAAIERSDRRVLLADASKFDRASLLTVCPLDALDAIVTDRHPGAAYREALDAQGVAVEVALGDEESGADEGMDAVGISGATEMTG